jgi:hypothetical protein
MNIRHVLPIIGLLLAGCSPNADHDAIAKAEASVRTQLKDPYSAVFSDEKATGTGSVKLICGRVNAKNGFGGYVGNRRFLFFPGAGNASIDTGVAKVDQSFNVMWPSECDRSN